MKINKYTAFLVFIMAFMSCDDPYEGTNYQIYNDKPISAYLSSDENFSEWVTILKYADLYNALNYANVKFTEFAPGNQAVKGFYAKKGVSSIEGLGKEYARGLVKYHTVLDTISKEEFINLDYTTNLLGDRLTIRIDSVQAGKAILNEEARVVEMALSTSNGVVYVLDDVMTPLVETVYDRVKQNNNYSILTKAIEETGWSEKLKILADTVVTDGISQITKRQYTLLAVSDATFAKDGITSYEGLKSKLGAGNDVTTAANSLYQYVAYHILPSGYTKKDLKTFSGSDTSSIWSTEAENQVMMVTYDSLSAEKYYFNYLGKKACFVESNSDIRAKNGYVHEIDSYLPVWEPNQATVVWDLTEYPEVRSIVGPELFQPAVPVSSETKFNLTDAACYTAAVSDAGVGGTAYNYLSYVTCKSNLKNAVHYDRLVLNLGYMGSVTMKTPTIVRGKYKVTLNFIYLSDHAFMRTMTDGNGGIMKISFDSKNMENVSPYTTVSSSLTGVYSSTLYDEIEFDTTSKHEFKIVVMDPAASTNSKFSLQLDCITFTPITE